MDSADAQNFGDRFGEKKSRRCGSKRERLHRSQVKLAPLLLSLEKGPTAPEALNIQTFEYADILFGTTTCRTRSAGAVCILFNVIPLPNSRLVQRTLAIETSSMD